MFLILSSFMTVIEVARLLQRMKASSPGLDNIAIVGSIKAAHLNLVMLSLTF